MSDIELAAGVLNQEANLRALAAVAVSNDSAPETLTCDVGGPISLFYPSSCPP